MKFITELIEHCLRHNLLTDEDKRKLESEGFYTFDWSDTGRRYHTPLEIDEEDLLEAQSGPRSHSSNRRHGKSKSSLRRPEIKEDELNQLVQEEWDQLTKQFPNLLPLWDLWKAGKLTQVFTKGFTLNDVYTLLSVELRDYCRDFSGPAVAAYRQLLRQGGSTMGKYSWVMMSPEMAHMIEFVPFQQHLLREVKALYETDRQKFARLSRQDSRVQSRSGEKTVLPDTVLMKVWTILDLASEPVADKILEAIPSWKTELTFAMQLDLDYVTELLEKLENKDWSSWTVIVRSSFGNTTLTSVVIPHGVTRIGWGAFSGCKILKSVVIPEGVVSIGESAFQDCSSLTSVVIPKGVMEIEEYAFSGCSSLTSIVIPEGVEKIGRWTFSYCSSLTSVVIPEGVTEICDNAFIDCRSLESVVIPEGVVWIGKSAFRGCSSLTSVVIPESVTEIGDFAFVACNSLKSVVMPERVPKIRSHAFSHCADYEKVLLSTNGKYLLDVNESMPGKYVIPDCVKVIVTCAFSRCSSLTSIVIPEGVTIIGDGAFSECSSLTSIVIPEGVTVIGTDAFSCCSSMKSVEIPKSVKKIGMYAFCYCYSLTSVIIPEGVTAIEYHTFLDCHSLTSVVIPQSVTAIKNNAFKNCRSLTCIVFPEDVRRIGVNLFEGCTSLTSVEFPESVTWIRWCTFKGCSSLTSVVIPEKVRNIGRFAFWGCNSLTSLVIPESVTKIKKGAFRQCPNLTIHARAGSVAEKYAKENGIPFKAI